MLDGLAALPPVVFALVVALVAAGLVALLFSLVALGSRRYLAVGSGVMQSMEQRRAERPQDYGDLVRLVSTLQALEVQEPRQQAIRAALLTKLTTVAPSAIRGGRQRSGWLP